MRTTLAGWSSLKRSSGGGGGGGARGDGAFLDWSSIIHRHFVARHKMRERVITSPFSHPQ